MSPAHTHLHRAAVNAELERLGLSTAGSLVKRQARLLGAAFAANEADDEPADGEPARKKARSKGKAKSKKPFNKPFNSDKGAGAGRDRGQPSDRNFERSFQNSSGFCGQLSRSYKSPHDAMPVSVESSSTLPETNYHWAFVNFYYMSKVFFTDKEDASAVIRLAVPPSRSRRLAEQTHKRSCRPPDQTFFWLVCVCVRVCVRVCVCVW